VLLAIGLAFGSALISADIPADPRAQVLAAAQAAGVALVLALAGWLVVWRVHRDQERRVFSLATVLLLGGAADYLSISALSLGLIAGCAWRATVTSGVASLRTDLSEVQAPASALLLLFAGANVVFSWLTVTLAVIGICCASLLHLLWRARAAEGHAALTPIVAVVALVLDAQRLTHWQAMLFYSAVLLALVPIGLASREGRADG
jgi:hypothetical protein